MAKWTQIPDSQITKSENNVTVSGLSQLGKMFFINSDLIPETAVGVWKLKENVTSLPVSEVWDYVKSDTGESKKIYLSGNIKSYYSPLYRYETYPHTFIESGQYAWLVVAGSWTQSPWRTFDQTTTWTITGGTDVDDLGIRSILGKYFIKQE